MMLEHFIKDWQPFRRALRAEYQPHFDELMELAERFAGPAGQQNPAYPYQAVLMSIVLAQQVERKKLEADLKELQERVEQLEAEHEPNGDAV